MTRKLFQKYDEETEQWLLQDVRDWPIDKFEIKAAEGDRFDPTIFNNILIWPEILATKPL